jgi:integrase
MAGNKTKPERFLYLQPEESKKFILAAYDYNPRIGLMMDITLNGGLRISETLNIKYTDIDFLTNKIKIKTLKRKTKDQIAELLFPESTIKICRKICEYFRLKPSEKLFPWTRQWAWKCFKEVLKKSKMSNRYSPHALRHAHGIIVAEITHGDPVKIAKRLRHSSLNYVYTYTHLTDGIQKEIIQGIEQMNKK